MNIVFQWHITCFGTLCIHSSHVDPSNHQGASGEELGQPDVDAAGAAGPDVAAKRKKKKKSPSKEALCNVVPQVLS